MILPDRKAWGARKFLGGGPGEGDANADRASSVASHRRGWLLESEGRQKRGAGAV